MYEWDFGEFEKLMGNAINYGVVLGQRLSGKSEVSKIMTSIMGYKVIDMNVIKKKLAEVLAEIQETDAENVKVSMESIYQKIDAMIQDEKNQKPKPKYVFDGFLGKVKEF